VLEVIRRSENDAVVWRAKSDRSNVGRFDFQSRDEQLLEYRLVLAIPAELGGGKDLHHRHRKEGQTPRKESLIAFARVGIQLEVTLNKRLDLFVQCRNPSRRQQQVDARHVRRGRVANRVEQAPTLVTLGDSAAVMDISNRAVARFARTEFHRSTRSSSTSS